MNGLRFEDRVALVVDRQSPQFKQIMRYYEIRNTAAHGDFRGDDLDILQIAADLQTLFGRLAT